MYYRIAFALLVWTLLPLRIYGQDASGTHVTEAESVQSATAEKALTYRVIEPKFTPEYLLQKEISRLNSLVKAQDEKIDLLNEKIKVLEDKLKEVKK
ncbi:hypothetical protein [Candidatus Electronema sp. JM]|uniref:hypothetical protein n=1 Tax=Candidatus Electronema sp. JM TaxID=3401571 RepID=UPI003AA9AFEE